MKSFRVKKGIKVLLSEERQEVLLSEEMQEVVSSEEKHCVFDLVIKYFSGKSHNVVRAGLAQGWVNHDNFCVFFLSNSFIFITTKTHNHN
jgi:hypothetical protein